jgi:small conductance mechanosensitive channel
MITETITNFFQNEALISNLINAAVIFLASLLIAGLARRSVRLATRRRETVSQIVPLLTKVVYWSILLLGLTVALQAVGINLTAVVAGLGIMGFTIGFALQDVSKNFVSGVLLLVSEPFKTGDLIEVSGYTGNVAVIDLRATELHTVDGRVVLIPNADVFTRPITNFSRVRTRRVEFGLGIPYGSDLETVRQTALAAIAQVPGLAAGKTSQIVFQNFSPTAIDMIAYYWIDTDRTDPVLAKDAGLVAADTALKAIGIDLLPRHIFVMDNPPASRHEN